MSGFPYSDGCVFRLPAFIVLELPDGIREAVTALRLEADPGFPPFPAEITLTGSSGVGPLELGQSRQTVFAALDILIARSRRIETAFQGIRWFAGSPIMYLEPRDAAPFRELHDALRGSAIGFQSSPFPYIPHCTIRSHGAGMPDTAEVSRVLALPFPAQPFTLETLTVYEIDSLKRECRRLHTCALSSGRNRADGVRQI